MLLYRDRYLVTNDVFLRFEIMDVRAMNPTQRRTFSKRQVRKLRVLLQDLGKT